MSGRTPFSQGSAPSSSGTSGAPVTPALTGATAATRYAGATASGAPASGSFLVGDFVIDQTGVLWICTVAGSPGTWIADTPAGESAWTTATLQNSWVAFGIGYSPAGYRKDGLGFVHLRGAIKSGSLNAAALTLPSGYRPAYTTALTGATFNGSTTWAAATVVVGTDGTVTPQGNTTNAFLDLSGLTFLGEQ